MIKRFQSCREFELELSGRETLVSDNDRRISVGRENCDIIVPHPKVSRHHADITIQSDGRTYLLKDRSSNGTVVNGEKIHQRGVHIPVSPGYTPPVIILAGAAVLSWETIEAAFREKWKTDSSAAKSEIFINPPAPAPAPQKHTGFFGWFSALITKLCGN
jgi:hypothetical protein